MAKLAIHGGKPVIKKNEGIFIWPQFDEKDERALINQLHESVSIYDKSGVINDFEEKFAQDLGAKYALLSNSGTSAIFSMYEGINLGPGDEVLCPVYAFHATVSPMMYTGASPIFCDCDDYGNITLAEIKKRITAKTKAVIISHMWGMPVADTQEIAAFCRQSGVSLLEDCSHAHGAKIHGQLVGSFGDAAAWSLQGQKTISGGEGGILITKSEEIFTRALLQGHYNKRPLNEIRTDHPLYSYYQTGFGQKFRAHPLAVRLGLTQYEKLGIFLSQRNKAAKIIERSLDDVPFIKAMVPPNGIRSSWYSFVMRFDEKRAFGVSRQRFVEALIAEGLSETDIPGTTGPLHKMPLFTRPDLVFGHLYSKPLPVQAGFAAAKSFHNEIVKLPVWTFPNEIGIVEAYANGIQKVSEYIIKNGGL